MISLAAIAAAAVVAAAQAPVVQVLARARQPGEALLIAVTRHHAERGPAGSFADAPLLFFRCAPGTYLSLAGIDLEAPAGPRSLELRLIDRAGSKRSYRRELRFRPKKFRTRRLTVAPGYVELESTTQARAEREAARLEDMFTTIELERRFDGGFAMPIRGARMTSRFGERRVFNGQPRKPHSGADIKASTGTAVLAPQGGLVVVAEDMFFHGRMVLLDHGLGLYSLYAHLSNIRVAVGRRVRRGERIGEAGATGRATGAHLHWSVRLGNSRVDPASVMALPLERWLKPCRGSSR